MMGKMNSPKAGPKRDNKTELLIQAESVIREAFDVLEAAKARIRNLESELVAVKAASAGFWLPSMN